MPHSPHLPVFLRELPAAIAAVMARGGRADDALRSFVKPARKPSEKAARVVAFLGIVRHWRLLRALDARPVEWDGQDFDRVWAAWIWFNSSRSYPKDFPIPRGMQQSAIVSNWAAACAVRAVRCSVPDWLDARAAAALGEERWSRIAEGLLVQTFPHLRVNRRKAQPAEIFRWFDKTGLWPVWLDEAAGVMAIRKPAELFETEEFQNGCFEQQDWASQRVAPFLDPQPGERVVDVCAGEGGKTLHLSDLMRGKGRILALDPNKRRLETLRKRAARADAQNIETRDSGEVNWKKLNGAFDRVLIDAPCSGLGTLRRHPDIKWRTKPEDLDRLTKLQAQLLADNAKLAKPGGTIVFATCSILPEEGEEQVRKFLGATPGFTLAEERRSEPGTEECDGFYMAKIVRAT